MRKDFFLEAMAIGASAAVVNQEAQGQREMTQAEKLPKRINHGTREQFEALGVIFGEPIDGLFVAASLPEGWKIVRTDHHLYTRLVDQLGRERATIFYKAAFYDQDAFMSITRRYNVAYQPGPGENWREGSHYVPTDWGQPIPGAPSFDGDDACERAVAWLDENFPDHKNPLAYLDLPDHK